MDLQWSLPGIATAKHNGFVSRSTDLGGRLRALGVPKFGLFVMQRLLAKATRGAVTFQLWHIFVQPVRTAPLLSERWRAAVDVKRLSLPDAERPADRNPFLELNPDVPLDEYRTRLARGDICLGAFRADRMIGQIWLCFQPFDESEVRCRFAPASPNQIAWDSNLYISERERGGIAFAALWDAANEVLRDLGCSWTASQTSAFNPSALRANRQLGAKRIGTILFGKLGPWQATFSTLPPHLHMSFSRSSVPEIAIEGPGSPTGNTLRGADT